MAEVYGEKPAHKSSWTWAIVALIAILLIAIAFYATR
jgi:hypothetical protein